MKRIILFLVIAALASCGGRDRDKRIKDAVIKYSDSLIRKSGLTYKLDSVRLLYVDSVTENKLNYLIFDKYNEKIKRQVKLVKLGNAQLEYDLSMMRLSAYDGGLSSAKEKFNEDSEEQKRRLVTNDSMSKVFKSLYDKLKISDSVRHIGFVVKSALYLNGTSSSEIDTVLFFYDKNNKINQIL